MEATQGRHAFIRFRETGYVDKAETVSRELYLKHLRAKVRATWFGERLASIVRLVRARSDPETRWSEWIRVQQIDIVWFLEPARARVSVPYITTVWDLAHRSQPYFPEVSITGWDWEGREQAYRSVLPRASFILTGTCAGKSEIVHYYGVIRECDSHPISSTSIRKRRSSRRDLGYSQKIRNTRRFPNLPGTILASQESCQRPDRPRTTQEKQRNDD